MTFKFFTNKILFSIYFLKRPLRHVSAINKRKKLKRKKEIIWPFHIILDTDKKYLIYYKTFRGKIYELLFCLFFVFGREIWETMSWKVIMLYLLLIGRSGANFTNLLAQIANAPALIVWQNQFDKQNCTNFTRTQK